MDFNKTSDNSGLLQLCETLCSMGVGTITGDTTLKQQFTLYLNLALGEIWHSIKSVNKTAKQDDWNYTDIPDAPITLVESQADYSFPVASVGANAATFHALNGIYYTSGTARIYLRPLENDEILYAMDGTPTAYRIQGKSIFFDVRPSATFIASHPTIHVEFQRIPSYFVSTDTTKQAGFMAIHHPLLAIKASSWHLKPIDDNLSRKYSSGRDDIPGDFESGIMRLKIDYANLDTSIGRDITSEPIRFR